MIRLIGVARILSGGVQFFPQKVGGFFSCRPQKTVLEPPNLPAQQKNVLKWLFLSLWEALGVWCALTNFACKARLNFFSALLGAGAPIDPLATPMMRRNEGRHDQPSAVASLGWVTPGRQLRVSRTLYFFPEKPGDLFWSPSSAVSPMISSSQKLTTFFAHRFIAFYCFHSGVTPSRVSPYTFFTCPTSFLRYSL